jgi:hypothetical protein
MRGTYIFFSSKMEQTLHSPSCESWERPNKEKFDKNYFWPPIWTLLKMWFFARFTLFLGYINPFFSSKMDQTLHSPSYGSKIPPFLKKFKKMYLTPYLDPLKMWHFACFTLFQGVRKYFFFHSKWTKLCTAPLMGLKYPPPLFGKNSKIIFLILYLNSSKMWLFARFTFPPPPFHVMMFHLLWYFHTENHTGPSEGE